MTCFDDIWSTSTFDGKLLLIHDLREITFSDIPDWSPLFDKCCQISCPKVILCTTEDDGGSWTEVFNFCHPNFLDILQRKGVSDGKT